MKNGNRKIMVFPGNVSFTGNIGISWIEKLAIGKYYK
jgi:hypothetical protein